MQSVKLKISAVVVLLVPHIVYGAEFYFGTQTQEVGVGQTFEVGVFLNTDGQQINAVEGRVVLPADLLGVQEVRDGGSLISFWVEEPKTLSTTNIDTGGHEIVFSGIIPGGYTGGRGYLFSLILKARAAGPVEITTAADQALLNDGEGTPARLRHSPLKLTVQDVGVVPEFVPVPDHEPPEPFVPEVSRESTILQGKWFLVFATPDKGSGIDRFEVRERQESRMGSLPLGRSRFVAAVSPYVLKDQSRESTIYVRAVDRAGNMRLARVLPLARPPWYEDYWIWGIIGAGIILIYFAVFRTLWRRKQKLKKH